MAVFQAENVEQPGRLQRGKGNIQQQALLPHLYNNQLSIKGMVVVKYPKNKVERDPLLAL